MQLRPRTLRRLSALLIVALLVAAAGAWWQHRNTQRYALRLQEERSIGLRALAAGELEPALNSLGRYIREADPARVDRDLDARLAYAQARGGVPSASGRHLEQSSRLLEDLLADFRSHPRRWEAYEALMQVQRTGGQWTKLRQTAERALDERPDDQQALRMRRQALEHLGELSAALEDSRRLNALHPYHLEDQIHTMRLMTRLGQSPQAIIRRATDLHEQHDQEPHFLLLLAVAYDHAGQTQQALACLEQAADGPLPAEDTRGFISSLAGLFDAYGNYERSRQIYAQAVRGADDPDPRLLQRLALRHWQEGSTQAALDCLRDVSPEDRSADAVLMALKTLLLSEAGRQHEALEGLASLRQIGQTDTHPQQRQGRAWHEALSASVFEPSASIQGRIEGLHSAALRLQRELDQPRLIPMDEPAGLLLKWIGDLYSALEETDLAVNYWQDAAVRLPAWAEPFMQIASARLREGQMDLAEEAARQAQRRAASPGSAEALLTRIAYRRWLAAPSTGSADKAVALATEHQRQHPFHPQTLPVLVHLTALTDTAAAEQLVRQALDQGAGESLRVELARVMRMAGLEHTHLLEGIRTPEALFQRAVSLGEAGRVAEGLALLDNPNALPPAMSTQRQVIVARFLERYQPEEAAHAWRRLGNAHPDDLHVQLAIINEAHSARRDRPFILESINRVAQLTGPAGRRWRLEKARWLLAEQNPPAALEAVDLLRDLIRAGAGSDTIEARILLAEGLLISGNVQGAGEHLRAAYELDPSRGDVGLRLIAILEQEGRRDVVRRLLGRLAAEGVTGARERIEVAWRLAEAGEITTAINLLQQASTAGHLDASGQTLLAELLASADRQPEAQAVYDALAAAPSVPPGTLLSAAVFLARQGEPGRAQDLLDRLEESDLPRAEKLVVRASFHAQVGEIDAARNWFSQALASSPAHASPWREALALEIGQAQPDRALTLAEQAAPLAVDDERLAALIAQAQALSSAGPEADRSTRLGALARAAMGQAGLWRWSAEAEALQAAAEALRHEGALPAALLPRLERAARRFPQDVAVHATLIEAYLARGEQEEAGRIARRLAETAAHDPEAQRLAFVVGRNAGRYSEAEQRALQWRRTHRGDVIWPDAAIADARLHQGDVAGALEVLEPHVERARRDPGQFAQVLALSTEAFAATGRYREAYDIAGPFLRQDQSWRTLAMRLAAERIAEPAEAVRWMRAVQTAAEAAEPGMGERLALRERLDLARAWSRIGMRLDNPRALVLGRSQLEELTAGPLKADPAAWEALARVAQFNEERAVAESAYRRLLALDPRRAPAANELAYLLLTGTGTQSTSESLTWARLATEEDPSQPAYQDTLARALLANGDAAAAQAAFERALRLDEDYLDAMLGLARLLQEQGELEAAGRWFARLDPIYRRASMPHRHLRDEYEQLANSFGQPLP